MKRAYILLCILLATLIRLGGCTVIDFQDNLQGQHTETEKEIKMKTKFTAQQLQILEKEGVPADYEQMTDIQKEYLERADLMMSYLNDKYGKYGVSFLYDGYHPAEMFDGEWLVAYPEGGDPELDRVSVDRVKGNKDIFEDDYLNVATRPYWKEILDDYLSQWFDPEDYRIYVTDAELEEMGTGDLPDLSKEFLENAGAISGTAYIYISEKACTLEKFEEFADAYQAWLLENQYYGSQDVYI